MRYDAKSAHAVEASGLVKRFGKTTALAAVDLVARQGRVLGVLGPVPGRAPVEPIFPGPFNTPSRPTLPGRF